MCDDRLAQEMKYWINKTESINENYYKHSVIKSDKYINMLK